jgi:hypothetical protein
VAQSVGPEFKPQYHQKKKERKKVEKEKTDTLMKSLRTNHSAYNFGKT